MYTYTKVYTGSAQILYLVAAMFFIVKCFFLIEVKYSEKDSLQPIRTRDVGPNIFSAVLTGLNPFTVYVINVSAFTIKGEGSRAIIEESTDEGREYSLLFIIYYLFLNT